VDLAIVPEGQIVSIVFKGHEFFKVLMGEIFERQLDVVGVKHQLRDVLKLEHMADLEPLQHQKQTGRNSFLTDLAASNVV